MTDTHALHYLTDDERAVLRRALETTTPRKVSLQLGIGASSLLRLVAGLLCHPDTTRRARAGLGQFKAPQPPASATPDPR